MGRAGHFAHNSRLAIVPVAGAMPEVFVSAVDRFARRALATIGAQAHDFVVGTRELISWKSQDGTMIEGVLIKPADFDPKKRYPLLCIIHGGPTGIDRNSEEADDELTLNHGGTGARKTHGVFCFKEQKTPCNPCGSVFFVVSVT
jgi:hypothetical protein